MRIVLDINVIISGIISKRGVPGQLLALWRERCYELVVSQPQLDRMQDVFARPRLEPYIKPEEVAALMEDILNAAVLVEHEPSISLSSDPEDNVILGTAIAGRAEMLVTGDKKHLVPLGTVQGLSILTPREAIEKIVSTLGS